MQDLVLFNKNEILVGGRPVFIKEWFDSNILPIRGLLNSNGQLLSFQEFNNKYDHGLETSDHVGCFQFADWLILWFKMAATEWKFVTRRINECIA